MRAWRPRNSLDFDPCPACKGVTTFWDDGVPYCSLCEANEQPRVVKTVYGQPYDLKIGGHPWVHLPYHEFSDGYRPAWAKGGYSRADYLKCVEHWRNQPKFNPSAYSTPADQGESQKASPSHTPLPPCHLSVWATSTLIH